MALVGVGSSVFHPEASRIARLASGGRHGLAQSVLQVSGNAGTARGPLLAAFVVRRGQGSLAWFSVVAVAAAVDLTRVGLWYRAHLTRTPARDKTAPAHGVPRRMVVLRLAALLLLVISKNFYLVSFYTFYLIETFGVSVPAAQVYLFVFLGADAVGTLAGGPVGGRVPVVAVFGVTAHGLVGRHPVPHHPAGAG